MPSMNYTS